MNDPFGPEFRLPDLSSLTYGELLRRPPGIAGHFMADLLDLVEALLAVRTMLESAPKPRPTSRRVDELMTEFAGLFTALPEDRRQILAQVGTDFFQRLGALAEIDAAAILRPGNPIPATVIEVQRSFEGFSAVLTELGAGGIMFSFLRALAASVRGSVLNAATLTMGVGALEVYLTQLIAQYYRAHEIELEPQGGDTRERHFTLGELRRVGSIDSAAESLIETRAESIIRGNFDDWQRWFRRQRLDIDLARIPPGASTIREIIQRRHLFVHRGGLVSQEYIRQTGMMDLRVGAMIPTSPEYVADALDSLLVFGIVLGANIWTRLQPALSEGVGQIANLLTFDELVLRRRWPFVRAACAALKELDIGSEARAVAQVNEWLSIRELEGVASMREEIMDWDPPVDRTSLRLAKAVLSEQADVAFDVIRVGLREGTMRASIIRFWPLLDPLRSDPRWGELLGSDVGPVA